MECHPSLHLTTHSFVVLPTAVITRGECSNPYCRRAHGFSLEIVWLCFSLAFDITF